jgi:hypothetical protein
MALNRSVPASAMRQRPAATSTLSTRRRRCGALLRADGGEEILRYRLSCTHR